MRRGRGADPAAARAPAALPTAVGLHCTVGAFNLKYAERLVHYFVTNDIIAEEKRHAILLTAVIVESVYYLNL